MDSTDKKYPRKGGAPRRDEGSRPPRRHGEGQDTGSRNEAPKYRTDYSRGRLPGGEEQRNDRNDRPGGDRPGGNDRDRSSRGSYGDRNDRKPFGDRDRSSRPERNDRNDRPGGDRPGGNDRDRSSRGSYGDRNDRKPFGDRDRSSRPERNDRNDRPGGDRPGGNDRDRSSRGSYGDRNDRKPFGDRDRSSRPERNDRNDRPGGDRDRSSRPERNDRNDRPGGDRDRSSRGSYGDRNDRKPFGDRDRSSRPERNDRNDRPGGDRDRSSRGSYGDRNDRKPFGDRDRSSRPERNDRNDRPGGDRDRSSRGSYGDRNDRKPFGDRDRSSHFDKDREDPIVATWEDDDLSDLQALPFRAAAQNKSHEGVTAPEGQHAGRAERPSSASGGGASEGEAHESEPVAFLPGVKPVLELLESTPERVDTVYLRKGRHGKEMDRILDICRAGGIRFSLLEKEAFTRVYQGRCQGVAARLYEAGFVEVDDLLQSVMDAPLPLIIVLDQVQDPGNAGTLARTLYCFGGAGLIVPRHNGVYLGAAAAKASAGALEKLPVARAGNLGQAVDSAKKLGFTIYGAVSSGTGESAPQCSIFSLEPRLPALLVLGSEESGLRPMMEKRCDMLLSIPMLRDFDSLNVAQAGAVLLGHFLRLAITR